MHLSQLKSSCSSFCIFIVNIGVLRVDWEIILVRLEFFKYQNTSLRNTYLLALCLANRALLIIHYTSQTQYTDVTHVFVVAFAQSKVFHVIKAKDTVFFVGKIHLLVHITCFSAKLVIVHT